MKTAFLKKYFALDKDSFSQFSLEHVILLQRSTVGMRYTEQQGRVFLHITMRVI